MRSAEEARARGLVPRQSNHSMNRRAGWHNYSRKGIYMITLVVEGRKPLFGKLVGEPTPHVDLSPLGQAILLHEIAKMSTFYPMVEVWKTIIMPDHIHFILNVKEDFPPGKHLGLVIRGFKNGCYKACRELCGLDSVSFFERGYNDQILMHPERLKRWTNYLADNPRRLWIKRNHPDLFTVIHKRAFCGRICSFIGNVFLINIPNKEAVIYHRGYSPEELKRLHDRYMACAENGGVLVSAAIASWEKEIMREALERGYRVIQLMTHGFPGLYKPTGKFFDACAKGQLLQVSPWEEGVQNKDISRKDCLFLNSLAEHTARL